MASRGFSLQEAVSADLDENDAHSPPLHELGSHRQDPERSGHSRGSARPIKVYKVVDENGKMVPYGGLGIPTDLTPSQKAAIQGLPALSPNIPESLLRFSVFFETVFLQCLHKNGYDPTKHFMRQGTAIDPDYQRMGFGRMIVRKCNEVADAAGKPTFARTRPTSLKLFEDEGFKLLEEIEIPYIEYGMEGESKVLL
ncbi:hypothetical protein L207DRAFT_222883 [Hyaloscypha variabilis F]|uniref:N-acetyltransferase domain-containing protein n=1 Tax=Hyaloscypha variabilis (strain UAMH 11265 / GT02V1 / F) TaxID=1149755 RepID=A0A2J6QW74_HYAVF|nr:hypothetical protein L207DRAFT_222883 [Hyaloscypha variabilis F]